MWGGGEAGWIVDGDHEVIISPVLFRKVQKALSRKAKVKMNG